MKTTAYLSILIQKKIVSLRCSKDVTHITKQNKTSQASQVLCTSVSENVGFHYWECCPILSGAN